MELYAKGQLSYLILTCMQERDFYGLDIISEISNRSCGRINLKKPSVYSNLTRMEKQGYISSYLKSSDFGPNRKYYSLTEKGRGFYKELKDYFDKNNIDVFKDFEDIEDKSPTPQITTSEEMVNPESTNKENNDFFDFSSLDNINKDFINENILQNAQELAEDLNVEETATAVESIAQDNLSEIQEVEEKKDDAVFLTAENVDEYNKRLYDISKDINKIKRKRSFADDQIAMTATDPLYLSNEKVKSNIEDFKNSILENRDKYQENRTNSFEYFKQKGIIGNKVIEKQSPTSPIQIQEEVKDDAKFITNRIDASQVERAKKIEPPRLKIVSQNTKDTRLPAPKRDKTIDPSHKDILNDLYSRTKDGSSKEVRDDAIYDYNDLKDYYCSQDISFNIYQKSMTKTKHNTNKLYFVNSVLSFVMCALISTGLYILFKYVGFLNVNTNFLYIVLPALLIFDILYKLYNYISYSGWVPSQITAQWKIWLVYLISSLFVVGLNFALGMAENPFDLYATTLILPLSMFAMLLPIRYYIKRLILVKYWR